MSLGEKFKLLLFNQRSRAKGQRRAQARAMDTEKRNIDRFADCLQLESFVVQLENGGCDDDAS